MNLILPLLGLMGGAKYAKKTPQKQQPKNQNKTQKPLKKPRNPTCWTNLKHGYGVYEAI